MMKFFDLNYFIKQTVVICGYWYVRDSANPVDTVALTSVGKITLSEYFKLLT